MMKAKEITDILDAYLDEFNSTVGDEICCRYSINYSGTDFFMDYCAIKPRYTKEQAELALSIFRKYAKEIRAKVQILNEMYLHIDAREMKTMLSSARIGKQLYVSSVPEELELKDTYEERGRI